MTITILIIVNVFSALSIIVLALMQQSKGDMGSAFGGGSSQSMFGSRGSANFLSRTTAVMCVVFFITSLSLAYMYAQRSDAASVVDQSSVIEDSSEVPALNGEVPSIDGVPTGETSGLPAVEGGEQAPGDLRPGEAVRDGVEALDEPDVPAVPNQ